MANNIKKDQILVKAWYLGVLLCIIAVIAALLINGFSDVQYKMEKKFTVKITSAEDLEKLGESIYNNNVVLQNDIHITDSNFRIGSAQHPFEGTFDGNGYTVIFDFPTVGGDYSLFGDLTEKAQVINTTFDFGKLRLTGGSFGGVAQNSKGLIKDCKVQFESLIIDHTGTFSPFVVVNNGEIINCVVSGTINNEKLTKEQEKSVYYGSLSVYNYGTINNVVAIITFENFMCVDEKKVFAHETDNMGIGAIVNETFLDGVVLESMAVVAEGTCFYDENNVEIEFINDVNEALTHEKIMYALNFDNRIWKIEDGDLRIQNAIK